MASQYSTAMDCSKLIVPSVVPVQRHHFRDFQALWNPWRRGWLGDSTTRLGLLLWWLLWAGWSLHPLGLALGCALLLWGNLGSFEDRKRLATFAGSRCRHRDIRGALIGSRLFLGLSRGSGSGRQSSRLHLLEPLSGEGSLPSTFLSRVSASTGAPGLEHHRT